MDALTQAAVAARARAYAPYSGYSVGAAVEDEAGRLWAGTNLENISYGATICAERSAVCRMVTEGGREIRRIAVATRDGGTPCGICLQVLVEFTPDPTAVPVIVVDENATAVEYRLSELLPRGFSSADVRRT